MDDNTRIVLDNLLTVIFILGALYILTRGDKGDK